MHRAPRHHRPTRRPRPLLAAAAVALVGTLALSPAAPAHGERVPPPDVPPAIAAPAGTKVFLVGHATGTQNYVCLPSGASYAWTLFGPQATLFDDEGKQLTTHYLSPNPDEAGTARPTWQHSRDTSAVWGQAVASSTDPAYVEAGAIPWLLVKVVGAEAGPAGGDKLAAATYIQRVDTSGGAAPATGCSAPTDVGARALVPYTTDYYFFKDAGCS